MSFVLQRYGWFQDHQGQWHDRSLPPGTTRLNAPIPERTGVKCWRIVAWLQTRAGDLDRRQDAGFVIPLGIDPTLATVNNGCIASITKTIQQQDNNDAIQKVTFDAVATGMELLGFGGQRADSYRTDPGLSR
ncbi:hypothetical protein [Aestuariirhabdus litorea]|uniref:hypothetical protein n=1 Tax=Aestuariirhabdus litorea TaxID=2528527 RepID=UPI000F6207D7|nr:hypothetical protein [Aestuariirhabdus litorea]RWW92980.1 hypothetical protein DZC74_13275 [Endozoicomonadaceae bacterium GTF-13]